MTELPCKSCGLRLDYCRCPPLPEPDANIDYPDPPRGTKFCRVCYADLVDCLCGDVRGDDTEGVG